MTTTRDVEPTPTIPAQPAPSDDVAPFDDAPEPGTPTGPVAAALLAAAVGSVVFGIAILLGDASPTIRSLLTWSDAVGPLSGRSSIGAGGYLVSWALLHLRLRHRSVDFGRVMTWSFVMIGVALVLIFPPFHNMFFMTLP